MTWSYTGNTGTTYKYGFGGGDLVNKEDLTDAMYNVDPYDTPFCTTSGVSTAYLTTHEWPEDTLQTAAVTGVPQGADHDPSSLTDPTRNNNLTQIFRWDVRIANTQLAVRTAGVSNYYSYEVTKGLRAIKVGIEKKVFMASGASTAGAGQTGSASATATATRMKTLCDFITTATSADHELTTYYSDATAIGGNGASAIPSVSGTAGESKLNVLLEKIYTNGGETTHVFVSPNVKRQFSTYTGVQNTRQLVQAKEERLYNSIDFYVSDYGNVQFALDRWVPQSATTSSAVGDNGTSGYFAIDARRVHIAYLVNRRPRHFPLAAAGDHVRGYVLTECTLEVNNAKAHGRLWGIANI